MGNCCPLSLSSTSHLETFQSILLPSISHSQNGESPLLQATSNLPRPSTSQWGVQHTPQNPPLLISKKERDDLAQKYIEMAQAEHASVASFALFTQKLLAIGAPAELINEALVCAKEEIEHAKYCFSIASYYAGYTIEPSNYQPHSTEVGNDMKKIVEDTIREGCIEETLSAMETARECLTTEDEYVKFFLKKITKDEAHHAAFSWKVFVYYFYYHYHSHAGDDGSNSGYNGSELQNYFSQFFDSIIERCLNELNDDDDDDNYNTEKEGVVGNGSLIINNSVNAAAIPPTLIDRDDNGDEERLLLSSYKREELVVTSGKYDHKISHSSEENIRHHYQYRRDIELTLGEKKFDLILLREIKQMLITLHQPAVEIGPILSYFISSFGDLHSHHHSHSHTHSQRGLGDVQLTGGFNIGIHDEGENVEIGDLYSLIIRLIYNAVMLFYQ